MKEWKTYKVGDICSSISETYKSKSKSVVLINTSDVLEGRCLNHEFVPNKDLKGQFKKVFKFGDILYSEIRPANKRFAYIDFDATDYIASTKLMVLRNNDKVTNRFLYHYLKSESTIAELQALAESRSGTFPQITFSELSQLEISIPDIETQLAISSFIDTLESKIELNRQINDNLEQQAQALYRSWFVDFEPFKEGKFIESEIGEIPAGWSIVKFGDIVEIPKKTINPQKFPDTIFNHYSLPACDNGLIAEVQAGKDIMSNKIILQSNTTLFSKLNPRIKRIWFTCEVLPNSICSTEFIPYRAKIDTEYSYIFSIVNSDAFYSSVMGCVNGATGSHQRFHAEDTEDFLCAYNKDAVNEFSKLIEPVLKQMHDLRQENVKLALTRDTLLPKLMSGELKINEIDC